jgi:hypothetical protein
MEWLVEFTDSILDFLEEGQYNFFQELVAWVMIKVTILKIEFMLFSAQFSWGVAQAVLDNLSIGDQVEQLWQQTDSYVLSWLNYFKIPQALNMILTAGTSKFVMRMVGW